MPGASPVQIVDSHTEGEPTRVVLSGGPELAEGSIPDRLQRFRRDFDGFRSAIVCEPRGSEVVVGALLLTPLDAGSAAAVIFFNDVGYLGMCGHGTIGVVRTLAYLERIRPGNHQIETPVGVVSACLHDDLSVTVSNVPSFRYRAGVSVEVNGLGTISGDIAWGGNWFFLSEDHGLALDVGNRAKLVSAAAAIREQLRESGIAGQSGAEIDHIELVGPATDRRNHGRNFVLCPGAGFDRSPCGTGTSAKMACLFADGKLRSGDPWRQEGILGTVFEGSVTEAENGAVHPKIRGRAWITGESKLLFSADDPFAQGIVW